MCFLVQPPSPVRPVEYRPVRRTAQACYSPSTTQWVSDSIAAWAGPSAHYAELQVPTEVGLHQVSASTVQCSDHSARASPSSSLAGQLPMVRCPRVVQNVCATNTILALPQLPYHSSTAPALLPRQTIAAVRQPTLVSCARGPQWLYLSSARFPRFLCAPRPCSGCQSSNLL